MLTSLLSQDKETALDIAFNRQCDSEEVEELTRAFAEHTVITDDNKNALLLICASAGHGSKVRAVLQAGANAAHTDKVRVGA